MGVEKKDIAEIREWLHSCIWGRGGCFLPVADRGTIFSCNWCPLEDNWVMAPVSPPSKGEQFFRNHEGGGCGLGHCGGLPTSGRSAKGR